VVGSAHLVAGSARIWLWEVSSSAWWCSKLRSQAMLPTAALGCRTGVEARPPRASSDLVARK
jgi:hypothetical protein